jgi:hypothetical protein
MENRRDPMKGIEKANAQYLAVYVLLGDRAFRALKASD